MPAPGTGARAADAHGGVFFFGSPWPRGHAKNARFRGADQAPADAHDARLGRAEGPSLLWVFWVGVMCSPQLSLG